MIEEARGKLIIPYQDPTTGDESILIQVKDFNGEIQEESDFEVQEEEENNNPTLDATVKDTDLKDL